MRTIEYVWIGGNNELRSKIKVLEDNIETIPDWNYDGSSTNQASGEDSEVIIKPRCIFNDPFQKGQLVLINLTHILTEQSIHQKVKSKVPLTQNKLKNKKQLSKLVHLLKLIFL